MSAMIYTVCALRSTPSASLMHDNVLGMPPVHGIAIERGYHGVCHVQDGEQTCLRSGVPVVLRCALRDTLVPVVERREIVLVSFFVDVQIKLRSPGFLRLRKFCREVCELSVLRSRGCV